MRLVFGLILLLLAGTIRESPAAPTVPASVIPLSSCGWSSNEPLINERRLGYDSLGNLWVAFVQNSSALLRRGDRTLKVITIGGQPLKCIGRFERATTRSLKNSLFLTDRDNVVLLAGDRIDLIDKNGIDLATFDISLPAAVAPSYRLITTPDSRTLVLMVEGKNTTQVTRLSSSLQVIGSCVSSARSIWLSSILPDGRLATAWRGSVWPPPPVIFDLCPPPEPSGAGLYFIRTESVNAAQVAIFVSNTFFIESTATGALIAKRQLNRGEEYISWAPVRSTSDGRALGVRVDRFKGGSEILDINGKHIEPRIDIYSSRDWRLSASIELPIEANDGFDFCFSPDGRTVAVLVAGSVRLYDLPK